MIQDAAKQDQWEMSQLRARIAKLEGTHDRITSPRHRGPQPAKPQDNPDYAPFTRAVRSTYLGKGLTDNQVVALYETAKKMAHNDTPEAQEMAGCNCIECRAMRYQAAKEKGRRKAAGSNGVNDCGHKDCILCNPDSDYNKARHEAKYRKHVRKFADNPHGPCDCEGCDQRRRELQAELALMSKPLPRK